MKRVIVTENPAFPYVPLENDEVISPGEYFSSDHYRKSRDFRVINLCRSYQYQSTGYYISMLAEARSHKVLPTISTMMDFKLPFLIREDASDFDALIQEVLDKSGSGNKDFNIYFGFTSDPTMARIGLLLFNLYQMPILKVCFVKKDKWSIQFIKSLNLKELEADEINQLNESLRLFLSKRQVVQKTYQRKKYDLAILVNPEEKTPPSDSKALQRFIKAADKIGFGTEIITKSDFGKITQFDALFIRTTTNVNHHSFRFARKAELENMAVIDDCNSILRCTNKVYLKELLVSNRIPTPKSIIFQKSGAVKEIERFGYPFVLKLPDGSFSQGVKKIENRSDLNAYLKTYFQQTDILIGQKFMPTDFDWRVGVLGGNPIYVCKYFMARNHWQIVDWRSNNQTRLGRSETLSLSEAPKELLDLAVKTTKLIGNGLYGVDIKEFNGKFYVIEVNDNPSIDSGVEDRVEKNKLYERIIDHLMRQVLNN
jgi:glutathione synthase/RimK-type ligase-like ATP-grasp enzyme